MLCADMKGLRLSLSHKLILASLAVALDVADRMRLPRPIYSFTLPLGAQINKDGTAIMLAGVLLFTAQAAGVERRLPRRAFSNLITRGPTWQPRLRIAHRVRGLESRNRYEG